MKQLPTGTQTPNEVATAGRRRVEIVSLRVGDPLGIGHAPGRHAADVKSWAQVLKEDP